MGQYYEFRDNCHYGCVRYNRAGSSEGGYSATCHECNSDSDCFPYQQCVSTPLESATNPDLNLIRRWVASPATTCCMGSENTTFAYTVSPERTVSATNCPNCQSRYHATLSPSGVWCLLLSIQGCSPAFPAFLPAFPLALLSKRSCRVQPAPI